MMTSKCLFILYLVALLSVQHFVCTSAELTEFLWSHDEVSGVYKNEDNSIGIKFTSRAGYLQISTLNNVTIVYFDSFHEVDKRMVRSVYMLDGEYLHHESIVHGHLDRPVGNTTKPFNDTITDLLHLEEITLLENATHAVGDQGVTGKNTPAVLPFYMFALKVVQLFDSSPQSTINETTNHEMSLSPRQKRFFSYVSSWGNGLATSWKGCKRYKNYPNCKGLCGRLCNCWWWVCGDCCYHTGCYGHDDCCERYGYYHWRCILAPEVLLCEVPFYC